MQQVYLLSDVESSLGALGYSVVRRSLLSGGTPERLTLLFLRDNSGFTQHAIIVPADALRGTL